MANSIFKIGDKSIGEDFFFIIEEAMYSWGDISKARNFIDIAADLGADGVEFQFFRTDSLFKQTFEKREELKMGEFSEAEIVQLIACAHKADLLFICTALDEQIVNIAANAGADAFNINTTDLNNPRILDAVSRTGLPFFITSLVSTDKELEWAVNRVKKNKSASFGILFGQHTMFNEEGVPLEEMNLSSIKYLEEKYNLPIGYVDHTPQIWGPACAVSAGAKIVTKHLSLSRDERNSDWFVCLEPSEMKSSIQYAKALYKSIRSTPFKRSIESKDRIVMNRSIVAANNLQKGKILNDNDIAFKRPGEGVSPSKIDRFIGKETVKAINKDEYITLNDIND